MLTFKYEFMPSNKCVKNIKSVYCDELNGN